MSFAPIIVIHGGAATSNAVIFDDHVLEEQRNGVKEAAKLAWSILQDGGSALKAVEAAVVLLEDNPFYNAGKGSALTSEGYVEMDASIMEGKSLRSGAVTCIKRIKNPVRVARLLMNNDTPIILAGDGAKQYALSKGFEEYPEDYFITELRREHLRRSQKPAIADTVGAMAIDSEGNVACASSTGGKTGKPAGRVGDTPFVGAGMYCDNAFGAVLATGDGDSFIRTNISHRVLQRMVLLGQSPQVAVDEGLSFNQLKTGGRGGLLAVNMDREIGIAFNGGSMAWAYIKDTDILCHGLLHDEHLMDKL